MILTRIEKDSHGGLYLMAALEALSKLQNEILT